MRTQNNVIAMILAGSLGMASIVQADDEKAGGPKADEGKVVQASAITPAASASLLANVDLEALAESDPMGLARLAMKHYDQTVKGYTCTLVMQERIDGDLTPIRRVNCRYMENPRSVYMFWVENPGDAKRALFRETPEFVDEDGKKLARVEPAGALIRLIVDDVKIHVNGSRAKSSSRRTIDQFGFRKLYELLIDYNAQAAKQGVLNYRFVGEGRIDGRRTWKFKRKLPYRGEGGPYPDALLILHIDQEYLLPTALYSYADHTGRVLLGRYEFVDIDLNPGLREKDFKF